MSLNRPTVLLFASVALFATWVGCKLVPPSSDSGNISPEVSPQVPPLVPFGSPSFGVIRIETLTLENAVRMNGSRATISFTRGKPPYTWVVEGRVYTVTGPADRADDDTERTVILIGDWVADSIEMPRTVWGVLRVIHHEARVVNGSQVPAWSEIRFEQVSPP